MLRITIKSEDERRVELAVEGRIIGDWGAELQRECSRHQTLGRIVTLDFSDVSFVDESGLTVLRRLRSSGTMIVNCPPLMEGLLSDKEGKYRQRKEPGR